MALIDISGDLRLPGNPHQRIWRYMDFYRFVALLNSRELFFTRIGAFDDPFEGSITSAGFNADLEQDSLFFNSSETALYLLTETRRQSKLFHQFVYAANCWHMNEHESAAMWQLYSRAGEGIAIQSTVGRLTKVIEDSEERCFIGEVRYIDYISEMFTQGNVYTELTHKRKSFEHEKELRVITTIKENGKKILGDNFTQLLEGKKTKEELGLVSGKGVKINVSDLVEAVYVSPNMPQWIYSLVSDTCKQFGFELAVQQSNLYENPLY